MSAQANAAHAARMAPTGAQRPANAASVPDSAAAVAAEGPVPTAQLQGQADRCYAQEWSVEEQRTLEQGLVKWPQERTPALERYLRIAATLPAKGVRDVALRVRWMQRFAQQKRRVSAVYQDPDTNRAPQRQRQGHTGSIFAQAQPVPASAAAAPANGVPQPTASLPVVNPYQIPANMLVMPSMMPDGIMMGTMAPGVMPGMASLPMQALQPYGGLVPSSVPALPMPASTPPTMTLDDHGSGGVGGVEGPIAALLAQNYAILDSFKQNMQTWRVNENTELLMTFRDNILSILNHMNSMGGVMADMPALPVRMNVELANNFLPRGPPGLGLPPFSLQMPMMGMFPSGIPGVPAAPLPAATDPAAAAAVSQQPQAVSQAIGLPVGLPAIPDPDASGANAASGQLAAAVSAVTAALPAGVAATAAPQHQQQQPLQHQPQYQLQHQLGDSPPTAVASSSPVISPADKASPAAATSAPQPPPAHAGTGTPAAGRPAAVTAIAGGVSMAPAAAVSAAAGAGASAPLAAAPVSAAAAPAAAVPAAAAGHPAVQTPQAAAVSAAQAPPPAPAARAAPAASAAATAAQPWACVQQHRPQNGGSGAPQVKLEPAAAGTAPAARLASVKSEQTAVKTEPGQ